ncbi:hypothetical protein B0H13DRAFT_1513080, partial [Mycena leptocephala]
SRAGLRLDALAALNYVRSDPELSVPPTILYGMSLGGALAIDLASRNPNTVPVMAENTFTSFPAVVDGLTLLGPFSFLCTQRWDPVSKVLLIPAYTPIFLLRGARDEVVPKTHMEALWEVA